MENLFFFESLFFFRKFWNYLWILKSFVNFEFFCRFWIFLKVLKIDFFWKFWIFWKCTFWKCWIQNCMILFAAFASYFQNGWTCPSQKLTSTSRGQYEANVFLITIKTIHSSRWHFYEAYKWTLKIKNHGTQSTKYGNPISTY